MQHFGFPFNYRTLLLDFCKETPQFPTNCEVLAKRIEREAMPWASILSTNLAHQQRSITPTSEVVSFSGHVGLPLTQLTANEYYPGQGIAPHTDTTACFGPLIFILTCNSGITMTFRKVKL